jgi:uncharacterized protein YlxW (UPF0749 family)
MTWLSFFFPSVEIKIRKLALKLNLKYNTCMALTTEQSVAVIETAITALTDLKAEAKAAQEALAPLAADNEALAAIVEALEKADAAVDAKLEELASTLAPAAEPEAEPAVEPVAE